jgi:GTPase SAR1 family protein
MNFFNPIFSEQSFRNIPKWITEADQHILHTDVPRLLVGTKNDLESQEVIRQRAQRFADANYLPLFEVSAKVWNILLCPWDKTNISLTSYNKKRLLYKRTTP